MATLHLVYLVPGTESGLSSLYLERESGAVRLAAREWLTRLGDFNATPERISRMEAIQWEVAERALACGVDVLIETNPKTCGELEPFRSRVAALGAQTRVYAPGSPQHYLTIAEGILQPPAMDEGW